MSLLIQRHAALKEATDLAVQQADGLDPLAADILTNVVIHTITTYQQKLAVGVEDSVADLVDNFKHRVAEAIFETAKEWKVVNREPEVFPRGCRFFHSKGETTAVVIEQDPQIRSLAFRADMLGEWYDIERDGPVERVPLALPYVVFVLQFKEGRFTNVYSGWRTSPLKTIHDRIALPLLPNIHDNMNVCVGHDLRVLGTGLVDQAEAVVSHFWQSQFNNDLSNRWWHKNDAHPRLQTARTWAEESANDPTFVLHATYNYADGKTVKEVLDLLTMHEEEPDEAALRHRLSERIDDAVAGLSAKIMRYFRKTRFDKHHPKDIKDALAGIIKSATGEFRNLVFAVQHEVEGLAAAVEATRRPRGVEGRGPLWGDYSP